MKSFFPLICPFKVTAGLQRRNQITQRLFDREVVVRDSRITTQHGAIEGKTQTK